MINIDQKQAEFFQYVWDGSQPEWMLAKRGDDKPYFTFHKTQLPHKYIVFNRKTGRRLLLEDESTLDEVVEQMRNSEVPVVDFRTYQKMRKRAMFN